MATTRVPPRTGPEQAARLSAALDIYNRAFRGHLSTVLRKEHGPDWWRKGVVRKISSIQQDIESHGEIQTDDDALSLLEPRHYHQIVNAHWESFPKLSRNRAHHTARTGGNPRTLMHEVADWRNVSAHPPARLEPATVDRAVEAMLRLVALFDPTAHGQLAKLSARSSNREEAAQTPAIHSDVRNKATDLIAQAKERARTLLNEAEREAADMRKAAKAETDALRASAKEADSPPTSRPRAKVPLVDPERRDRAQPKVREPGNKEKAHSELKAVRHDIMVLRKRADEIKAHAKKEAEQAEQTLRKARTEAAEIRAESLSSEAYQYLRNRARAQAEDDVAVLRTKADQEAKAVLAKAKEYARNLAEEAHTNARNIKKQAEQIRADTEAKVRAQIGAAQSAVDHAEQEAARILNRAQAKASPGAQSARNDPGNAGAGVHDLVHRHQPAAGVPAGVQRGEVLQGESARLGQRHGQSVAQGQGQPTESHSARRVAQAAQTDRSAGQNRAHGPHRAAPDRAPAHDLGKNFTPARSGNGRTRSLNVNGWRLTCWVGNARGVVSATVFAPWKFIHRERVDAQDTPLMERDCNSEEEAFAWLQKAETSGDIEREARRAIRIFESSDDDDRESGVPDDDIPF